MKFVRASQFSFLLFISLVSSFASFSSEASFWGRRTVDRCEPTAYFRHGFQVSIEGIFQEALTPPNNCDQATRDDCFRQRLQVKGTAVLPKGAKASDYKVLLYLQTDNWYLQPFNDINADKNDHGYGPGVPGISYAVLQADVVNSSQATWTLPLFTEKFRDYRRIAAMIVPVSTLISCSERGLPDLMDYLESYNAKFIQWFDCALQAEK